MRIILSILFLSFISAFNAQEDASAKYGQAKAYENDFRYKKAIKFYSEAINLEPDNKYYHLDRGLLLMKLDRPDAAKADFIDVVEIDLENVRAWQALGDYFLYKEVPDSTIYCINKSISFDHSSAYTVSNLIIRADAYMLQEKYEQAYSDYMNIVEVDSANTRVLRNLAYTCHELDKPKESIYYLRKIAENNPGDTEALINVGYAMTQIGLFRESLVYFNTVLDYDKDQPYALSNRSFALFKIGELEQAMKDATNSIKNDPQNSYGYWVRGSIYAKKGNATKACKDFNQAEKYDFREEMKEQISHSKSEVCRE